MADTDTPPDDIIAYHQASKHHFGRYAAGPNGLDWANQPNPFRRFHGADLLPLLHGDGDGAPSYGEVTAETGLPCAAFDHAGISELLRNSLALSAWKQAGGNRWALRVNPSSGNLHPTEGYLICAAMRGLAEQAAVYHYAPKEHALERRTLLPPPLWQALGERLGDDGVLLGLSSIHWREAWKYGVRAFRYCQHDVGHAIGALSLAAAGLGWQLRLLDGWSEAELSALLGLDGQHGDEQERPDCLLAITPAGSSPNPAAAGEALLTQLRALDWSGQANRLSPEHRHWEDIQQAIALTSKPSTDGSYAKPQSSSLALPNEPAGPPLAKLVRQRRSAVAMDGHSGISYASFTRILQRSLAATGQLPFTALPWAPQVDLLLFVHRVQGLDPGLYLLLRGQRDQTSLAAHMKPAFEWQAIDDGPPGLWRLATGDARQLAQQLSCQQEIASDGCFSIAMLSQFTGPLAAHGQWFYPRLFWECGLIGQLLYLEATASGIAATGIGCFFDDAVHELLGLSGEEMQVLYHFTLGAAVIDTRLSTLPPYP